MILHELATEQAIIVMPTHPLNVVGPKFFHNTQDDACKALLGIYHPKTRPSCPEEGKNRSDLLPGIGKEMLIKGTRKEIREAYNSVVQSLLGLEYKLPICENCGVDYRIEIHF